MGICTLLESIPNKLNNSNIQHLIITDQRGDIMPRKETVTKIIDGDTFETSLRKKRVRIDSLDTPERGQSGYREAKNALSQLLKGEKVTVTPVATDNYGRTVAKVKKGNRLVSTLMQKHKKKS